MPLSPSSQDRAVAVLRWMLGLLSAVMVLLFLVTAKQRLAFPYSYNETGMLESVRHVRAGMPLYAAPNVHFTPYLYTPLFFYAAAWMSRFTPDGFMALRLVSLLATLGCFVFLYAIVQAQTRRPLAAFAAVGCFASSYPLVLNWFDVGRVDMLYMFFVAAALFFSRPRTGSEAQLWRAVLAGLLWVAAFQTKQGVLPVALLALAYDWERPRRIAVGVCTFLLGFGASFALLQRESSGWYSTYIFGLVGGFGFNVREGLRFVPVDILEPYGVALLLALGALLLTPPRFRKPATLFYACGCLTLVVFTGYLRLHRGAGPNALLPAYFWIAVLFGLAIGRLTACSPPAETAGNAALCLLLSAAIVQLAMHVYLPSKYVPKTEETLAREAFVAQLRSIPGDVMVPSAPEYAVMAGKGSYADSEATGAVIEGKNQAIGEPLLAQYESLIRSGTLAAVVTDRPAESLLTLPRVWLPRDFLHYYPLEVKAAFSLTTQTDLQPRYIYLPCSQVETARRLQPGLDTTPCAAARYPAAVAP